MEIDIYNYKFIYNFKQGDKVSWNKKIFKSCPFNVDETKTITEISKTAKNVRLNNKIIWWNWWELTPTSKIKKLLYYIKFYIWYYLKFKRL